MPAQTADDAVSEVIGFLLIFALVVAALAVFLLVSMPSEGQKTEIQHDNLVMDQFAELKNGVDLLWTTNSTYINNSRLISLAPTQSTDLASRLFLAPTLGSGSLRMGNGTAFYFTADDGGVHYASVLRLTYASDNQYSEDFFVVYDGGAVFFGDNRSATYLLLSPIAGNNTVSDEKEVIILNATQNEIKSSIGNTPVAIEYAVTSRTKYTNVNILAYNEGSEYTDYWQDKVFKNIKNLTVLECELNWRSV